MFFSYMLLLFLLGTSVNAERSVKFTVEGLDIQQEKDTKWYRLERPKDMGWNNARDNDAIQINQDRTVTLFTLGKNGNAMGTVSCNQLHERNYYFMAGVWGAVPNAGMSIAHRNRELHCNMAPKFECHVQTAETPKYGGTASTSPPPGYIGDKYSWYRITSGGGDINDVIFDLQSNALPKYGVLDQFGTAKAVKKRIGIDHMIGTFRLLPSMDIRLEHRRVQLTVSVTEETKGGKKFVLFGGQKTKQVLHYQFNE